ncbi:RNA polymerase I associated factor, A49-like protein [Corchorus olitorius]|uniref:RNA polymerase I associated factor, A49-like protein n=1 Tax=Corchorus olitorius TaxID=93759 RepID=A0A1R3H8C8_9ROSI|nr:RNA polymerase I associated factor, A49-like protein [Corchorus olitorius]
MEEKEPSSSKSRSKKSKKQKEAIKRVPESPEAKQENIQVKIQVFQDQQKKIPPLVAYFPSGYNPNPQEEEDGPNNNSKRPRVKVYRNMAQNKHNRLEVVVSPNGSNVDFVGSSYRGEAAAAQLCRYSLGVLDKESGTLKIVPIASNKIFRLEPRVRGLETAKKDDLDSARTELTAETKEDKMGELTALYGTKKDRKKRKDLLALKKEVDPESQKSLDKKIEQVAFNKEALGDTIALIARNIPPHDSSATSPQDAYPLDQIILKGDWEFLEEDIYRLWQEGGEVSSNAYPTFVCNRIKKLEAIEDEDEKWKLACLFSFITHLLKFNDQCKVDRVASAKNHKIPNVLLQRFHSMFAADQESKSRSPDQINRLISYVLVLTLHADQFRTDPRDIAKDLKMSPINLRTHFENLGCKRIHEKTGVYAATLPVPLKFPSENLKRKRRR